jgi:hypothetical protein
LADQFSVPTENRIGGEQGGRLGQEFSAQGLGLHGQPATLLICQLKLLPAQLLKEDFVFLLQLFDCLLGVLIHHTVKMAIHDLFIMGGIVAKRWNRCKVGFDILS